MKIRDNETGKVFDYGTDRHHALSISEDGKCLYFENLQNGDGSLGDGYSFVLNDGKTPEESDSNDAAYGAAYANIGGFRSNDIEKILQEISDGVFGTNGSEKIHVIMSGDEGYIPVHLVMDIIKRHLSDFDTDTNAMKDTDGWNLSKDKYPEESQMCWITTKSPTEPISIKGMYTNSYGSMKRKGFFIPGGFVLYDKVVAWMLYKVPDPYKPAE